MSAEPEKKKIEVTEAMVKAASEVYWVWKYRCEFGVDDDAEMAKELSELLVALTPFLLDRSASP
jgi:hypothetical protein